MFVVVVKYESLEALCLNYYGDSGEFSFGFKYIV